MEGTKESQTLAPPNTAPGKARTSSFLDSVLGVPYTSKKSNFLGDFLAVDESPRQRSHSVAGDSPSRRPDKNGDINKTEQRDSSLIMKSRNISITEAILGRRHSTGISSILNLNFDGDTSVDSNSGNSGQSTDYLETFEDPCFTKESCAVTSNVQQLDVGEFQPNFASESHGIRFVIEEAPPSPVHQKPMIDVFLDHVNSFSWVHGMIPKKKLGTASLEAGKQQIKGSGAAYSDDLLMDRIYKHLHEK